MNSKGLKQVVLRTSTFTRDSVFKKLLQATISCINWCLDGFPET